MVSQIVNKTLFVIVVAALSGCGKAIKKGDDDAILSIHALCNVMNNAATVVCIDYADDRIENQSACNLDEKNFYASRGANAGLYVGVGASATTGCHMHNRGLVEVGSCLKSGMNIRYYTSMWSVPSAQGDCLNRQGHWKPDSGN